MFTRKRLYPLLATVITFFLGIAFQYLIEQILPLKVPTNLILIIIVLSLGFIVTILIDIYWFQEKKFENIEIQLDKLMQSGSIRVQYIDDNYNGSAYSALTEIIEKANKNLTFVTSWIPEAEYQPGLYSEKVATEKRRYYKTIIEQIEKAKGKDALFHRMIIQVPPELYNSPSFSYEADSSFVDFLYHAAETQDSYPRICQLNIVSTVVGSHFTIVDDKYVIMTTYFYLKNKRILRHGAIIIYDGQGELIKYYNLLYWDLEARSKPLLSDYFPQFKKIK